jgi:hypothetical protein
MKKMLISLFAVVMILGIGFAKHALTVDEIEPLLSDFDAATNGHLSGILIQEPVEYVQIGNPDYDEFFLNVAKLNGTIVLSNGMTTTATGQLKKFAMSKVSNAVMKDNISDFVGNTPPEQWTTEQCIAVMIMAKKQDEITADEEKYFLTTAGSLAIVVVSLGNGVAEAEELLPKGKGLLDNIKSVSRFKIPKATKGLKLSLDNLNGVVTNAPIMLEEMNVLLDAFVMLQSE